MSETHKPSATGVLARDPQMPSAGDVLNDRYVIRESLGEGGFAVVYRADDKSTSAEVAVKVMDPVMSRRDELAQRFLREVETVSRLRHHHTIKVSDKGETANGCLFLVMELLKGLPLDTYLERHGPLPPEHVRQIAMQVLKSLAEAHAQGVIHRDLKPANIFLVELVGEEDEIFVKVLDFGIAKSLDNEEAALTSTGQVMCSPHYVAPERVMDHVTLPASDLYSLGVMMIELLEGSVPYDATTPIQVVLQHARIEQPVPMKPSTENGPLGTIIRRAVNKRYGQRYQNAKEMLSALQALGPLDAGRRQPGAAAVSPGREPDTSTMRGSQDGELSTSPMARKKTTAEQAPLHLAKEPTAPAQVMATPEPARKNPNRVAIGVAAAIFLLLLGGAVALFMLSRDQNADNPEIVGAQAAIPPTPTPVRQDRPIPSSARRVTIETSPAGAAIRVGEQFVGTSPVTLPRDSFKEFPVEVRAELTSGSSRSVLVESADALDDSLSIVFDEDDLAAASEQSTNGTSERGADETTRDSESSDEHQDSSGRPHHQGDNSDGPAAREQSTSPQRSASDSTQPDDEPNRSETHADTRSDAPPRETPSERPRPAQPAPEVPRQQPEQPATPSPIPSPTPLPPSNRGGYGGSQGGRDGGGNSYFGR